MGCIRCRTRAASARVATSTATATPRVDHSHGRAAELVQRAAKAAEDQAATRAGMCLSCPYSSRDGRGAVVGCLINGQPLRLAVRSGASRCPMGWWPDAEGRVRWRGFLWWGVPFPKRLGLHAWSWATKGRLARLPGCGCLVGLKAAAERARAVVAVWWRRAGRR